MEAFAMIDSLKDKRVLVTGACGFMGSHLVGKLLAAGCFVYALDRPEAFEGKTVNSSRYFPMTQDITKPIPNDSGASIDAVYHLAAIAAPIVCEKEPEKAFLTNVLGTYDVLQFALKANARKVIFLSSAHVYGISPKYMPTGEVHPLALLDNYTTTKVLGEHLCSLFYDNHQMPYITFRLFNSFGPRQPAGYFIPDMINKARTGHITLKGRQVTKDFIYIDDVIDALLRGAVSDYVGPLNIGSGKETDLGYVAQYIADKMGAKIDFDDSKVAGPTRMQCDNTRARKILGWEPRVQLEKGLDATIPT
jgi:nucleoside-diphosphate-sugar epimerase